MSLLGPFWIALQSVPNSCNLHALMYRGAYYFEKIIEKAMSSNDIWVGTRAEIADHVLSRNAQ